MDWVYKATRTKVPYIDTMILATRRGFLCRSAREPNGSWADNVQKVQFGDVIHFYYIDERVKSRTIGSFDVIDSPGHHLPHLFGSTVSGSALKMVVDQAFAAHLASLGDYRPDPELNVFTGWALAKSSARTPVYDRCMFNSQSTLREFP